MENSLFLCHLTTVLIFLLPFFYHFCPKVTSTVPKCGILLNGSHHFKDWLNITEYKFLYLTFEQKEIWGVKFRHELWQRQNKKLLILAWPWAQYIPIDSTA